MRLLRLASSALVLGLTACAGASHMNTQAAQAAATDSAIRASRARLEKALQAWQADSLERLMATDSFQAQLMGLTMSRSEMAALARSKSSAHPSLIVTPKQSEYCVDAGYETGTFGYRPTTDAAAASRYGSYAMAWTTAGGPALVRTLIVDSAPDPRRIVGRVSCQTWRSVQLRSRRAIISVTPVYDHQGTPRVMFDDLNAAGWTNGWVDGECAAIGDKHADYANVPSSIDINSVAHPSAMSVLIDARFLLAARTELEVAGSPKASTSCSTGFNASDNTGVSSSFTGRTYAAYVSRRFADLRVGIGPAIQQVTVTMRQANVKPQNPNRGAVTSEVGEVSTSKTVAGIGLVAGYTLPLGGGFVADLNARATRGPSLSLAALPAYSPKSVATSSYQLGVSLGWAR